MQDNTQPSIAPEATGSKIQYHGAKLDYIALSTEADGLEKKGVPQDRKRLVVPKP